MDDKEMLERIKKMEVELARLNCNGYPGLCALCGKSSCIGRPSYYDDIGRWKKLNV